MTSLAQRPDKGSPRVQAWIYAVINPWIDALQFENGLLERGILTFRYPSRSLEHVRAVRRHLAHRMDLVLEDLGRCEPIVKEWEGRHDELVQRLAALAAVAHQELAEGADFRAAVEEAAQGNPEASRAATEDKEELARITAERVVNRAGDLDRDYSDSRFWNAARSTLLPLGKGLAFDALDECRTQLMAENARAGKELEELRWRLVDEFQIPPTPLS